jgi:hypothetical protein
LTQAPNKSNVPRRASGGFQGGKNVILLGSFLHRDELDDLLGRALEDRFTAADARRLKVIVNLNAYAARTWSDAFATELFQALHGVELACSPATCKSALKDLIVANPPVHNRRVDELLTRYAQFPEDFYRETPYDGMIFTTDDPPRYGGSRRIKRVRRIAEKSARRLVDYMYDQIRQRADELASERARRLGIPKDQLITPVEEMAAEFTHAERRVLKSIREHLFVAAMPHFHIDDVVGIRVLADADLAERFDAWLGDRPDLSVVDEKRFSGDFVGRNMVLAYRLPLDRLRRAVPTGEHADRLISRGVAPDQATLEAEYLRFVDGAEGHVRFEVLLIDYEQLLESEIGRSMHEAHVLDQRENQVYKGRLATNVEALMNWLFAFALSPCTSFDELPIRMRGTYLPDYFDRIHRRLYELPHGQHGLTM